MIEIKTDFNVETLIDYTVSGQQIITYKIIYKCKNRWNEYISDTLKEIDTDLIETDDFIFEKPSKCIKCKHYRNLRVGKRYLFCVKGFDCDSNLYNDKGFGKKGTYSKFEKNDKDE